MKYSAYIDYRVHCTQSTAAAAAGMLLILLTFFLRKVKNIEKSNRSERSEPMLYVQCTVGPNK